MANPILYVTDFSPNSVPALHHASKLAAQTGEDLVVAHVSDVLPTPDNPSPVYHSLPSIIAAETAAKEQLDQIEPTAPGVTIVRRLLHGDPAEEIIRHANEIRAQMIVLGTHGRTGLLKLLMGSVAEAVVRGADCPVVVVKPSTTIGDKSSDG
ncbi:MAG: universal stress protein [Planctomycetota bacterium]